MARSKPVATVRSRRLAVYLRSARQAAGLSFAAAAEASDLDDATIRRAEKPAECRPQPNNVKAMLIAYGVTDAEEIRRIVDLAKQAAQPGWWNGFALSADHAAFVAAESEASAEMAWEPSLVPGLLQLPGYARVVIRSGPELLLPGQVERLVRVRTERQKVLVREDPLRLSVIIGEEALRRVVGTPALMREQLWHLAEAAMNGPAVIRVLPDSAGAHPAMSGPFAILRYDGDGDHDVLYCETLAGALYEEADEALERARRVFSHLETLALSPRESMDLTARYAADL